MAKKRQRQRRKPAPPPARRRPRLLPEEPAPRLAPRGRAFPKGNSFGAATRFKPGQTGNPGGIPKTLKEFREAVRDRAMVALDRIDDVLDHGSEEGIIKASREVFAYAWGRPTQPIGGDGGGPVKLTFDDVRRRLTEIAIANGVTGDDGDGDDDASDPGAHQK